MNTIKSENATDRPIPIEEHKTASNENAAIFPTSSTLQSSVFYPKVSPEIDFVILKYNELSKEVKESKREFLIYFGFFASFVTFLSAQIQIIKYISDFWIMLGFCSFLLSSILLFALSINSISKEKSGWKEFWSPSTSISLIFLLISILSFFIHFSKIEVNDIKPKNQQQSIIPIQQSTKK